MVWCRRMTYILKSFKILNQAKRYLCWINLCTTFNLKLFSSTEPTILGHASLSEINCFEKFLLCECLVRSFWFTDWSRRAGLSVVKMSSGCFVRHPGTWKKEEIMICGLQILPFPFDFEENCGEVQRFLFKNNTGHHFWLQYGSVVTSQQLFLYCFS